MGENTCSRATLVGPGGASAALVSVWVVRAGEDFARFVTAYPEDDAIGVLDTHRRLDRDVPEHGLRKGDLGAVVEQVYSERDGLEVEFVTASGRTAALLTLSARDVRPVADDDLVSVRTVPPTG